MLQSLLRSRQARFILFLQACLCLAGGASCSFHAPPPRVDRDLVVQLSTLGALSSGLYDGLAPISVMSQHGDLGLGTFEHLDGEMVQIDGQVYQVTFDGKVRKPEGSLKTPFFTTTRFEADQSFVPPSGLSMQALQELIDARLPSPNLFYALRIDGLFLRVKTRSVPKQSRPYPSLSEVVPRQSVFDLEQVRGTAVGFRSPAYAGAFNAVGYHFHFLDDGRSAGGHVIDFVAGEIKVQVDTTSRLEVLLPEGNADWSAADLSR